MISGAGASGWWRRGSGPGGPSAAGRDEELELTKWEFTHIKTGFLIGFTL